MIRSLKSHIRDRAGRPVIFVVDDDPASRATIMNDLMRRFGNDYRIVSAGKVPSGEWTVVDFNLAFNAPCAF